MKSFVKVKVYKHGNDTSKFLNKIRDLRLKNILDKYGKLGVEALKEATPKNTGLTADSWYYEIHETPIGVELYWCNSNTVDQEVATVGGRKHDSTKVHTRTDHIPIVILLQYGHGTGTGGYVQGRDFINPAIQPIFDEIAKNAWEEVSRS